MTEISVRLVIRVASEFFGVAELDMLSDRRPKTIARPRQCAIWAARTLTRKSFSQIGRIFGRDHTTVLHAVRLISAGRETDEKLNIDTSDLLMAIRVAAVGLERLNIAPVVDIDVCALATDILEVPLKATTVSVDEVRALAAATISQQDQLADVDPLYLTRIVQETQHRQTAIDDVLVAARAFKKSQYSQGEGAALQGLCAKLSRLLTAEQKYRGGQNGAQKT